jgi:acyl dehydratase
MVRAYAEITGDFNPLHVEAEFTGRTRFEWLIVQGGLTAGLLNALVAMDMPGPGSVFMSQSWTFPAPVYIGDTIRAEATVTSVHESKPIVGIQVVIRTKTDRKCSLARQPSTRRNLSDRPVDARDRDWAKIAESASGRSPK